MKSSLIKWVVLILALKIKYNEAYFIFSIESFLFGFSNMFIIKSLPSINKEDDTISIELNDGTILNYEYNGKYKYFKYDIKENMSFYLKDNIPIITYIKYN